MVAGLSNSDVPLQAVGGAAVLVKYVPACITSYVRRTWRVDPCSNKFSDANTATEA